METLTEERRRKYERSLIIAAQQINPRMAECFLKCAEEEQNQVMLEPELEAQSNFYGEVGLRELAKQFMLFVKETDPILSKFLEEGIRENVLNSVRDVNPNININSVIMPSSELSTSKNNDFAEGLSQDFLNFLLQTDPNLAQYLAFGAGEETSLDADESESDSIPEALPSSNSESLIISTMEPDSGPALKSIPMPKSLTKIRCCLLNVAFAVDQQIGRCLLESLLSD